MINVCLVVNSLLFGGVEKVIENYLSDFDSTQFEFSIITQDNASRGCIKHFESLGFKVLFVTHKRKNFIKNKREIKQILRNNNYDIVHSHMSRTNFYVLKIAKECGTKVRINHYHNVFEGNLAVITLIKAMNRLCDNYATDNIFCSDAVKNFFGNYKKPGFVLHNAIDLNKFKFNEQSRKMIRDQYKLDDSTFVMGHVGRFVDQKNHLFLVDVFNEFHINHSNSVLMLVGEGPLENEIKNKIEKLNIVSSVIFVGSTSQAYLFYQAMDFYVFPSLWEGLGLTFLEAQISGLPCIGSDILTDESVVSKKTKRLPLNAGRKEWAKNIVEDNSSRYDAYDSRIDKYDLDKCKNTLFEFYKKKLDIE